MSKRQHDRSRPQHATGGRPIPLALVPPPGTSTNTPARINPPSDIDAQQLQLLIGMITTGHLDDHLPVIQAAISHRHRQRHRTESNHAAAHINIGDRVQLTHDIRPLYLHGATGTVTGWTGQSVIVQLDQPTGRFTTGQIHCPPLGLQPLPA